MEQFWTNAMIAVSAELITKLGLYALLPVFICFLVFIMWDIAKKSGAGKNGTFWIFLALGAGIFSFAIKVALEYFLPRLIS